MSLSSSIGSSPSRQDRDSVIFSSAPNLGAFYVVPIIGAMEKSTHTTEYAVVRAELKAAREAAQLSQRALAARLGVPHSWIAKVEAGERRIDVIELSWYLAACDRDACHVLADLGRKVTALRRGQPRRRRRK